MMSDQNENENESVTPRVPSEGKADDSALKPMLILAIPFLILLAYGYFG